MNSSWNLWKIHFTERWNQLITELLKYSLTTIRTFLLFNINVYQKNNYRCGSGSSWSSGSQILHPRANCFTCSSTRNDPPGSWVARSSWNKVSFLSKFNNSYNEQHYFLIEKFIVKKRSSTQCRMEKDITVELG